MNTDTSCKTCDLNFLQWKWYCLQTVPHDFTLFNKCLQCFLIKHIKSF